jgi:hypothetical protein
MKIENEIKRLEKENTTLADKVALELVKIHKSDLKWLKNKKN